MFLYVFSFLLSYWASASIFYGVIARLYTDIINQAGDSEFLTISQQPISSASL